MTLRAGESDNLPKGEVDLILQTVVSDEYTTPFKHGDDCDQYFEKAKRENSLHMASLKAIFAPPRKTSCEQPVPPSRTQIISMEKTREAIMFSLDANRTEPWIITGHPSGYIHMWNYDTQKFICSVQTGDGVTGMLSNFLSFRSTIYTDIHRYAYNMIFSL